MQVPIVVLTQVLAGRWLEQPLDRQWPLGVSEVSEDLNADERHGNSGLHHDLIPNGADDGEEGCARGIGGEWPDCLFHEGSCSDVLG